MFAAEEVREISGGLLVEEGGVENLGSAWDEEGTMEERTSVFGCMSGWRK